MFFGPSMMDMTAGMNRTAMKVFSDSVAAYTTWNTYMWRLAMTGPMVAFSQGLPAMTFETTTSVAPKPSATRDAVRKKVAAKKPAPAPAPKPVAKAAAPKVVAPEPAPAAPKPAPAPKASPKPALLKAARAGKPDDLTKLKGVGPKLQETLNEIGIYHFDQIAGWTPKQVAWIDDELTGINKGRASRDGWVAQAQGLSAS